MKKLTKIARSIHNGVDLIPLKMGFGKIGSGIAGAALLFQASGEAVADNHIPGLEHLGEQVVAQISANYRECVQTNLGVLDMNNNGVIDTAVDPGIGMSEASLMKDLNGGCDEVMANQIRAANADQRIDEARAGQAAAQERIAAAQVRIDNAKARMDQITANLAQEILREAGIVR